MRIALIILSTLTITNCSYKSGTKDQIKHLTLKLEKSLNVRLEKKGKSKSTFNIIAHVDSPEPFLSGSFKWIVTDFNNQKISEISEDFSGPLTSISFDSGTIDLANPELNYKIIFIFNGKTKTESIHKTQIYNSLIQEDLDRAIEDLQERNKY